MTVYDPQYPYGWGLTTLTKTPGGGLAALNRLADTAGRAHTARAGRDAVDQARRIVPSRIADRITAASAKPFAEADHLLLTGRYAQAVRKLIEAYRAG